MNQKLISEIKKVSKADVKILREARKILKKEGVWCKNYYKTYAKNSPTGFQCCAVGAIDSIKGTGGKRKVATQVLFAAVVPQRGVTGWGSVEDWNDADRTTKKKVLLGFEKAIKLGDSLARSAK